MSAVTERSEQTRGWTGSRGLLRRLRDIMGAGSAADTRLDQVVALIARHMEAEVGSLYVLRPGEILELAATEGLAPDAVHHTRLRVGEGLVGIIAARARSLALADAQAHPDFAYRPETGEEAYSSLMGVPVLRGGRVLGVLVVQNVQPRDYTEEEAEALETVAMVLAEALAGSALSGGPGAADGDLMPARLGAIALTEGLGMGRAVAHRRGVAIARVVAENLDDELERLAVAMERMHKALDAVCDRILCSQDQDRDWSTSPQPAADFDTVNARQHQIQNDQVGWIIAGQHQTGLPIGSRVDLVAFVSQTAAQKTQDRLVIFDDQYACTHI